MKRVHMTPEGKVALEEELRHLEGVARFKSLKILKRERMEISLKTQSMKMLKTVKPCVKVEFKISKPNSHCSSD